MKFTSLTTRCETGSCPEVLAVVKTSKSGAPLVAVQGTLLKGKGHHGLGTLGADEAVVVLPEQHILDAADRIRGLA